MRKETKNGVTYTFETDDLTSEAVVSKITLKALLPIAEENDMMAIKSYILSQINKNGITKQKFYI